MTPDPKEVTRLLASYSAGDPQVLQSLLPLVYEELRRLAQSYMRKENSGHTLQPTALVHEAFFKLLNQNEVDWQNRAHFFGVAAQMMRRILMDHARARRAEKRGGGGTKIQFEEAVHWNAVDENAPDLLALDEALQRLAQLDERQSKVVELRYFGGLSIDEIAAVTETSPATVKRDWTLAKAWLRRELSREPEL